MDAAARRCLVAWESLQVELHGRYSIDRLLALERYEHETTTLHALAVVLLTPVSCAVVVTLADVVPLQSAYAGLGAQGPAYWIRTWYTSFIVCSMSLVEWSHSSPALSLPWKTACIAPILMAIAFCLTFLGLHLWIGFPTPFLISLQTVGAVATFGTSIYVIWGSKLCSNATTRRDFICFVKGFWHAQVLMLIVYPAMIYVFRTLDSQYQTLFSMALPVLKMAIKNLASYGVRYIEQYAPVCISFSVDVFHTLFLASAMQSSTGTGTLAVVTAVDLSQSLVAGYEVYNTMDRIQRLGLKIDSLEAASQPGSEHDFACVVPKSNVSSALSRAAYVLMSSDEIRNNERICPQSQRRTVSSRDSLRIQSAQVLKDHTRPGPRGGPSSVTPRSRFCGMARNAIQVSTKTRPLSRRVFPKQSASTPAATSSTRNSYDEARLCYVEETMQLLFMMEFYLLIELVEVVVPTVYSIYLAIIFYLPNRYNYAHLKTLTDEQFLDTQKYVAKYAALELVSLVALALALRRVVRVSPLHHLAFTLQTNWKLAQALLTLWVFFPIQLALDHIGNDYTMKFAWLHKPPQS